MILHYDSQNIEFRIEIIYEMIFFYKNTTIFLNLKLIKYVPSFFFTLLSCRCKKNKLNNIYSCRYLYN